MPSQFDPNLSPKFTEATKLLQQQRISEAIRILEELTGEKPQVGEYWFALGVALAANDRPAEALAPMEKACQAIPRPPRACYNLGRLHQAAGRHEQAVTAFETAGRNEVDSTLFAAKAISLEVLERRDEADGAYRVALAESALRPKPAAAIQFRYAQFLVRWGKLEASLWQLNQSIRKQPFEGVVWKEKARVLLMLDRKMEAANSLEQAIAHGERNRENLALLSRLYLALGDKERAEIYRREAEPEK